MAKRRRTDNTMANRRRTDNTMAKRRRTDNTMAKRRRTDNTIAKRRRTDNTMAKRRRTDNTMAKRRTDNTMAKRKKTNREPRYTTHKHKAVLTLCINSKNPSNFSFFPFKISVNYSISNFKFIFSVYFVTILTYNYKAN
jgi:predicted RNA-binding protein